MTQVVGPQYSKDKKTDTSGFLESARLQQSTFRAEVLDVPFDHFGSYLTKEDAEKGLNFYNGLGVLEAVKDSVPEYDKALYSNMLRDQHLAYNFCAPFQADKDLAKAVLNAFLDIKIETVEMVLFAYQPTPNTKYLDESTLFDVYVTYIDENKDMCALAIQVQYATYEAFLKKGSKEEKELNTPESVYNVATKGCGLYKEGTSLSLKSDNLRKIWKNQLLGERIVYKGDEGFKRFSLLTLFPEGNVRFAEACDMYKGMLVDNKDNFAAITYSEFINALKSEKADAEWVEYLQTRYAVK